MPPPTRTLPDAITRVLQARQTTVTVVSSNSSSDSSSSGSNLSGGAIAGIVIGSIAGILLLWWIIRSLSNLGAPPQEKRQQAWYDDSYSRPRSRSRHHSRGRRGSRGSHYVQEVVPVSAPRPSRTRRSREMRTYQPAYASSPRRSSKTYVSR